LPDIGEAPFNDLALVAAFDMSSETGLMTRCFYARLAKSSPVSALKEQLAVFIGIQSEAIAFAYEGKTLDGSKTLHENGIVELGAAARRRGAKIEIKFVLSVNVELPEARAKREQAERARKEELEALERQRLEKERTERQRLEASEQARMAQRQQEEVQADEERRQRERCVVRCGELGTTAGVEIQSTSSTTVANFLEQLRAEIGVREGRVVLMNPDNGEVIDPTRGQSLREAGINNQMSLYYFFEQDARA